MSNKRLVKDIESVSHSIEHYNEKYSYYYEPNDSNMNLGHVLILGVENSPYFGGFYFFENNSKNVYRKKFPRTIIFLQTAIKYYLFSFELE